MSNLTRAQERALQLDKNISVTAGAGSGKTKILVERVLKILMNNPASVRRILAITFTKKAAGEMQERIAAEVNDRLAKSTDSDERRKLLYIRDHLNSASISTIHGFCSRILREYPLEAGLSPDFSELDEIKSIVLRQETISRAFESISELPPEQDPSGWISLFARLGRPAVTDMLNRALSAPYEIELIANRFRQWDEQQYISFLETEWLKMVDRIIGPLNRKDFYELSSQILNSDSVDVKNEKGLNTRAALQNFKSAFEKNPDDMDTARYFIKLLLQMTGGKGQPYKNLAQLGSNKGWNPSCKDLLVELSEQSAPAAQRLLKMKPGPAPGDIDREWFRLFNTFLDLYQRTAVFYQQIKNEQSLVDFEDLQLLLARLLDENEVIREQLYQRFDYLMVDEFQDTNALQWQIISRLASRNGQPDSDKVFVVGDPKQSIYGFRDADIRIFKNAKQGFAEIAGSGSEQDYTGNVVFEESFRFLPCLNAWINTLFSDILQEDAANPFEVGYHPLRAMRDLPGKGWVELALLDKDAEQPVSEAQYIAGTIQRLIAEKETCFKWQDGEQESAIQYGDIAILMRSRTNLLEIEQALRRLDIPFKTAGGVGFWQKQEIYDIYHLLRFLNDPSDDFAMIAILRSKLLLIPDSTLFHLAGQEGYNYLQKILADPAAAPYREEDRDKLAYAGKMLSKWLACRERMNLSELLEIIMDDLQFKALLASQLNGDQIVANVEKLIEQAQSFDAAGLGGLQDFLNHIDDLIEREMREGEAQITLEDSGTVKIMTIHASKGLQFPVVFVPFVNTQNANRARAPFSDAELGLACKLKKNDDGHVLYNLIRYRNHQKELAEAKRLFYVAATRASNYLFLSAELEESKVKADSALQWIADHYQAKSRDIFEIDSINEADHTLTIVHNFDAPEFTENNQDNLFGGLKQLSKIIKAPRADVPADPALQPVTDRAGAQTFSATRVMTFMDDPEEYYRRYQLGFFEGDYESFGQDMYQKDNSLLKGKIVHRYLELLQNSLLSDEELFENILFEFDVFDPALQDEFRNELLVLKSRMEKSENGREIIFAAEARNELTVTMLLGDDYFTGTLDRIYRNPQGQWEVVDYKTNRVQAGKVEPAGKKYEWQIRSYALLLSRLYPEQENFPVLLYFLHPDKQYRRVFSRAETAGFYDQFKEKIDEIKRMFG